MAYELRSIEVRNLHGFDNTRLDLSRDRTVLVGPNNAGKTAVLTMLNWLLNEADDAVLTSRAFADEERAILVPARTTGQKARRLTLHVYVPPGSDRKTFQANKDGIALLRYDLRMNPDRGRIRLGEPSKEKYRHDPGALDLLNKVREDLLFLHVPSFRDVQSQRFKETLRTVYRAQLQEKVLHDKQGQTTEARVIGDALNKLREVSEPLVQKMWGGLADELPPGLAEAARFQLGAQPSDLLDWLIEQLIFNVTTAPHDKDGVQVGQVGAGLQSLLDLAVNLAESKKADRPVLLAVEEPEAFLHPSAQRTLARRLLRPRDRTRLIVTTHSALVVDEADAANVVLVKGRRFYSPSIPEGREDIHTAYMRDQGAEAMFARGVLLVEGPADALFFDALRRRVALATPNAAGDFDQLRVVWTGSNTQFGPWIQLFDAYGQRGDRPIEWLAVLDADAGTEARAGLNAGGVTIPQEVVDAIGRMNAAKTRTTQTAVDPEDPATAQDRMREAAEWRQQAKAVNTESRKQKLALRFLPVDLEDAILEQVSTSTCHSIWDRLNKPHADKTALLYHLGSKAQPKKSKPLKEPWVRGFAGGTVPPYELGGDIQGIITDWFALVMAHDDARVMVEEWCTPP